MKSNLNTPEIPLCTNILRLQSYLLTPDELILFDWFTVKQFSFGYKEFHYSQSRIEEETRIKRRRQDVIIDKFTELGFLTTTVKENLVTRGRVRYFYIDFKVLADETVLCEIINPKDAIFKSFISYMKHLSSEQRKATKTEKKDVFNKELAQQAYQLLNDIYETRREMYNEGEITDDMPERMKAATQLQINKPIERKLIKLMDKYGENALENAFISYTDAVFKEEIKPDNFMNYFLSYNQINESFTVFEHHLNNFNMNYGHE